MSEKAKGTITTDPYLMALTKLDKLFQGLTEKQRQMAREWLDEKYHKPAGKDPRD